MSKDITAMQQAIEKVEKMVSIRNFQQWEQLKKQFLELEKQQIIDAHRRGQLDLFEEPIDYYTQTYKTDTNG